MKKFKRKSAAAEGQPAADATTEASEHDAANAATGYLLAIDGLREVLSRVGSCQALIDLAQLREEGETYLALLESAIEDTEGDEWRK